jgi:mRNA-degrading endonuclease YafQ of YafQ-DinJ toxin-antitoxin module
MELNKETKENIINYIKELNDDINQLNKDIKNLQAKRETRKEKIKALIHILSNQLELEIE